MRSQAFPGAPKRTQGGEGEGDEGEGESFSPSPLPFPTPTPLPREINRPIYVLRGGGIWTLDDPPPNPCAYTLQVGEKKTRWTATPPSSVCDHSAPAPPGPSPCTRAAPTPPFRPRRLRVSCLRAAPPMPPSRLRPPASLTPPRPSPGAHAYISGRRQRIASLV